MFYFRGPLSGQRQKNPHFFGARTFLRGKILSPYTFFFVFIVNSLSGKNNKHYKICLSFFSLLLLLLYIYLVCFFFQIPYVVIFSKHTYNFSLGKKSLSGKFSKHPINFTLQNAMAKKKKKHCVSKETHQTEDTEDTEETEETEDTHQT